MNRRIFLKSLGFGIGSLAALEALSCPTYIGQLVLEKRRLLLVIGDSTSAGTNGNTGSGPTPAVDTCFYFQRSGGEIHVMNPDFVSAPAGTQFPKAGIDYYAAKARGLTIIPSGLGGSFITNFGTNWS